MLHGSQTPMTFAAQVELWSALVPVRLPALPAPKGVPRTGWWPKAPPSELMESPVLGATGCAKWYRSDKTPAALVRHYRDSATSNRCPYAPTVEVPHSKPMQAP